MQLRRVELVGDEHDHHVWAWNWHFACERQARPWIKIWGCIPTPTKAD